MKVTVQLFAILRERAGSDLLVLDDLPDALDLAGLGQFFLAGLLDGGHDLVERHR